MRAVGRLSEALEWIERARGALYEFHQLIGRADRILGEAADQMANAGHRALAADLTDDLVGRNVLPGRWTFQIIEEFDDGYWTPCRAFDERVRNELVAGQQHVFEAEVKENRRN